MPAAADASLKTEPVDETEMSDVSEYAYDEDDELDDTEAGNGRAAPTHLREGDFNLKLIAGSFVVNRSVKDLFGLMQGPGLVLDPSYQRDVVWDNLRSSQLIRSLMAGYFIPPIIFNCVKVPEKPELTIRVCVDGKQRLTSIKKFMTGVIGVHDSSKSPLKWYYCYPEGASKGVRILPERIKQWFRKQTFCCYEFSDLPERVEEEMFQLVQRGMPLTPAEKMRALSTKWATFAKQYEAEYSEVVNLCSTVRALGFRAVVTIFAQLNEVESPSSGRNAESVGDKPQFAGSVRKLDSLLRDNRSLDERTKLKFKQVFDKYRELVNSCSIDDPEAPSGRKILPDSAFGKHPDVIAQRGQHHVKTFSPVEQLSVAVLLHQHMATRNNNMLLGDIMEMRIYLREEHHDLRTNQQLWESVWRFVDADLVRYRGGEGTTTRDRDVSTRDVSMRDDSTRDVSTRDVSTRDVSTVAPSAPMHPAADARTWQRPQANGVATPSWAQDDRPAVLGNLFVEADGAGEQSRHIKTEHGRSSGAAAPRKRMRYGVPRMSAAEARKRPCS
jgi:hypothetical protein